MPKIGSTLRPTYAQILRGGRATAFLVPSAHFVPNRGWVDDGVVQVIVNGELHWKLGDCIKIKEMTGWSLWKSSKGRRFFRVYAEIEYIPLEELDNRDETTQKLFEDVPEEYLNG